VAQELLHSILRYYIYFLKHFLEALLCSLVTTKGLVGHKWPAGHGLSTPGLQYVEMFVQGLVAKMNGGN
jgi:hypothetical protein